MIRAMIIARMKEFFARVRCRYFWEYRYVKCSWCKKVLKKGVRIIGPVSHTICEACLKKQEEEDI